MPAKPQPLLAPLRPLHEIAAEIRRYYDPLYFAAEPYVDALAEMSSMNDRFCEDSGDTIVLYLIQNLRYWRGPVARRIKFELQCLLVTPHAVRAQVQPTTEVTT